MIMALIPTIDYEKASWIAALAKHEENTVKKIAIEQGLITEEKFRDLIIPEAICKLGD